MTQFNQPNSHIYCFDIIVTMFDVFHIFQFIRIARVKQWMRNDGLHIIVTMTSYRNQYECKNMNIAYITTPAVCLKYNRKMSRILFIGRMSGVEFGKTKKKTKIRIGGRCVSSVRNVCIFYIFLIDHSINYVTKVCYTLNKWYKICKKKTHNNSKNIVSYGHFLIRPLT